MILAIDIGNTHTAAGFFRDGKLVRTSRLPTRPDRPSAEIGAWLAAELSVISVDPRQVSQTILSSVVPDAVPALSEAVRRLTGHALTLARRENIGLAMQVNHPETVGADRLIDALAASKRYTCPLIIMDLGTATTLSVLDSDGRFVGGAISPGLQTSADSLHRAAAQLPAVDMTAIACSPAEQGGAADIPAIGNDTAGCIRSGVVQGTAAMLDGLILRIEEQLGCPATHIITGGFSTCILPFCRQSLIHEPDLLLLGLHDLATRSDLL